MFKRNKGKPPDDFLPTTCLYNPYYIGDTVLLEPIARTLHERLGTDVFVLSNYPELFIGHPTIRSAFPKDVPAGARVIDMSDSIKSLEDNGKKSIVVPNNCRGTCKSMPRDMATVTRPMLTA